MLNYVEGQTFYDPPLQYQAKGPSKCYKKGHILLEVGFDHALISWNKLSEETKKSTTVNSFKHLAWKDLLVLES